MDNMTKHRNMMWLVTVVAVAALAVIPAAPGPQHLAHGQYAVTSSHTTRDLAAPT